ncbi:microfibril-associated glycoprotein 4-like [Branchiostoma lanceolatum]|uniref:microfibril-associated glycoprotein 4-like n=1 Tax=Branchiostoma lanceolatum TaxID=7740 RepID=UPI003456D400
METKRCIQLLHLTLVIIFSGKTMAGAGDIIGGKGGWSTDCTAVKTGTWISTFRPPAGSPRATHLQLPRVTWEHLKQLLQTAKGRLDQVKRSMEPLEMIDCAAIFRRSNGTAKSGVYTIRPAVPTRPVPAYCRMEGRQGWTVLQRRQDGSVDFFRTWDEYKRGFGNLTTEFWLGNDNIHMLTNQARYKLRVDLETWDGEAIYALYRTFSVSDEASSYKLTVGNHSGTADNALWFNGGNTFVTYDRDTPIGRARMFRSAGWLDQSYFPSLNGVYYTPQTVPTQPGMLLDTIRWHRRKLTRHYPLLKFVEMRIAPEGT